MDQVITFLKVILSFETMVLAGIAIYIVRGVFKIIRRIKHDIELRKYQ